jgi:PAS domain S-box-containing protein
MDNDQTMKNGVIDGKQAEDTPPALRLRQKTILQAIPDILMEVNKDKIYTWANQPGFDFFGNDVIGKKADHFFEGTQNAYDIVQPIFEGSEETIYLESLQKRKDGEKRLLAWHCRTLKNEKGSVIGAVSSARDITEYREAEESAVNSQKLLQRIIDLLPIRIFWKDRDLKYLGCNVIFAKDAGKSKPEELIGKDDFAMGWKEQAASYQKDDRSVMDSGQAKLNFEEPQTTPKGDEIWLKTSKVPLTDSKGIMIGILGTYEDITEHKRAEDALHKKIEEIEKMNELMTGREIKMIELKKENEELKDKISP